MTLGAKYIFIGQEVEKEIKGFGLTPKSVQLKWFFDVVKKFYVTACKYLQKYFALPLKSVSMVNMSALTPLKQSHVLTTRKLKYLAGQYSKVIDNIEPFGGMDKVKSEIDQYVTDDDVRDMDESNVGFEQFWEDVGELTDGGGGWIRYEVLPRFALAMGTKHNATGDVERAFSIMNLIHQDKQRNRMSQDTLNSHLHIRSGVESKENRSKCNKCKDPDSPIHCHCVVVEITDSMRQNCKKAWEKCRQAQRECANERKETSKANLEKIEKAKKDESDRIQKVKESLASKPNFCPPHLLKPVYPPELKKDKKENKKGENTETSNNNKGKTSEKDSSKKGSTSEKNKPGETSKNSKRKDSSSTGAEAIFKILKVTKPKPK